MVTSLKNEWTLLYLLSAVVLGSTPSLPAESCREIKANEAGEAVSGNPWLDPTGSGEVILAYCDMDTEGLVIFLVINRLFYARNALTVSEGT